LIFAQELNYCYGIVSESTKKEPKGWSSADTGYVLVQAPMIPTIPMEPVVEFINVYSDGQLFHPLLLKGQKYDVTAIGDNFVNEDCSEVKCDVCEAEDLGDRRYRLKQMFEYRFQLSRCVDCKAVGGGSCKNNRNEYSVQMTMGPEALQVTLIDSKSNQGESTPRGGLTTSLAIGPLFSGRYAYPLQPCLSISTNFNIKLSI